MQEAQVTGVPHRNVRHFISASTALAGAKARFAEQQMCLTRKTMSVARKALHAHTFPPGTDFWLTVEEVVVHPQTQKVAPIACTVVLRRMSRDKGTPLSMNHGGSVPKEILSTMKQAMERDLTLVGKFVVTVTSKN